MAIGLFVCVLVSAASAAPTASDGVYRDWQQELFDRTELNNFQEVYPAKRSNYGGLYVSPCAAASAPMTAYTPVAAAPIPAYVPATGTPYSYSHAGYQTYQGHVPPHYSHPYYRTEDEVENEQEMLGFSDMNHGTFDHVPMARYSYGAAPMAPISASTSSGQAVASNPVVGVFSNTNVGGCSVPLLVSCTPSIAHGRILKTQPYYNDAAYSAQQSNLYRGVDEQPHHDEAEGLQQKTAHSLTEHSPHNSKLIVDKHQWE